jgi:hypothetical protein
MMKGRNIEENERDQDEDCNDLAPAVFALWRCGRHHTTIFFIAAQRKELDR